MPMSVLVLGYGPVGRATTELLAREGRPVRVAQRSAPAGLPAGVDFAACDCLDPASVRRAAEGAEQIVLAVGFPYEAAIWQANWPRTMTAVLDAAADTGARVVFVDNLYMYGPQTVPLHEELPLADIGGKPGARAAVTRQWMAARDRVRFAAVRAADFYGPGVRQSHLGETGLAAVAAGKPATMLVNPDLPHDYVYVPDFARAVMALLDAPDDCYGQAWHVPCAPITTPRAILELGAAAAGRPLQMRVMPQWLTGLAGLMVPFVREMREMRFQWDRPYHVDASKMRQRFGLEATPFAIGAAATVESFRPAAGPA